MKTYLFFVGVLLLTLGTFILGTLDASRNGYWKGFHDGKVAQYQADNSQVVDGESSEVQ